MRYWVSACAVTWNLDTASWSVAQQQYSVLFNFQENLNKQDLEMQDWLRFDLYVKMEKRLVVRSNGEALQRFRDLELMQTSFISYKNRVSMMLLKLIPELISIMKGWIGCGSSKGYYQGNTWNSAEKYQT